jgi:predicted 2-oxoglutarate/Fe(II)-dependent dioxygenase YbiX
MNYHEAYPQLFIFPEFISGEELEFWQSHVRQTSFWNEIPPNDHNEDINQPNHYAISAQAMQNPNLIEAEKVLVSKINGAVQHKFGETFLTNMTWYFRKWVAGMEQGLHHDSAHADWTLDFRQKDGDRETPPAIAFHDVATILYYNDDFDGGELFLYKPEISIKPSPGMLVMMPCTDAYIHGVRKITAGERYISAHFWTRSKTVAMVNNAELDHHWRSKWRDPDKVDRLVSNPWNEAPDGSEPIPDDE